MRGNSIAMNKNEQKSKIMIHDPYPYHKMFYIVRRLRESDLNDIFITNGTNHKMVACREKKKKKQYTTCTHLVKCLELL